jgi:hypothetical protein
MKFPLGRLVATPAALDAMESNGINPAVLLKRHLNGDWGDMCKQDQTLNDAAISDGTRILSSYVVGSVKVWVITEADRSSTCILLAEEY